jgi:hypothetical protein
MMMMMLKCVQCDIQTIKYNNRQLNHQHIEHIKNLDHVNYKPQKGNMKNVANTTVSLIGIRP